MKSKKSSQIYIFQPFIMLLLLFLIIFIVNVMDIKIDSRNMRNTIGVLNTEKVFMKFIKSENHYFFPELDKSMFTASNLSTLAFQLATTIKPTDARTFLGNEIPGLRIYDTEIVLAGEGTNLTNLPSESTPPMEVLLNEREVAEEKLNSGSTLEDETPIKNPEHKTVFIYQTHSWESFLPLLRDVKEPDEAISSDERANVVGLGQLLTNSLIRRGIGVEHDKTNMTKELNEIGWEYTKAYNLSRQIIESTETVKNNELEYFIDIHRDSARRGLTTKNINGEDFARLYFVVGKEHKNYLENLELAKSIHRKLEKRYPGISRGVFLKAKSEGNGVYNQDVSTRAMLLEIGGVDNNLDELKRTIEAFSDVLADYYWRENEAKEVNGNG